jgi:hypothetical protein
VEIAFLLLIVASAAAGFLLRRRIGATTVRAVLGAGLLTAALGILTIVLVFAGWFPFWIGALFAVILLAFGGLLLPFGLTACLSRRT